MDDNNNNNRAAPSDGKNQSNPPEISIRQKLNQLDPLSSSCCIYRVRERLRCLNPDMYTPKVVSIGPLHHGKETLQEMEDHKYRYLKQFLVRTQQTLQFYIQEVRNQEAKLRSYYAESINFDSNKFVTIILVDSAFIIELFRNFYVREAPTTDRIIGAPWMIHDIIPDLLLLENQVPFFILENLFDLGPVFPITRNPYDGGVKLSLIQLFRNIFQFVLKDIGVDYDMQTLTSSQGEGKHFLDIVRNLCLPSEHIVGGRRNLTAPSITELRRAGVKIRVRSTRNLFSIRFDNGRLEIPNLTLHDGLEQTLKNLVAFEQCHCFYKRIAEYFFLLDGLVNTPKDVEFLIKYGIITNDLGDSSEPCSLINNLCKEIHLNSDDICFATLHEDLHKHCKRPWNKWKASLRQNYLNSPWAIASVVVASFLIILTIIQTVCSLIQVSTITTVKCVIE